MIKLNKKGDHPPAERLFAQLSPAARRKYFDTQLGIGFSGLRHEGLRNSVRRRRLPVELSAMAVIKMAMEMGLLEEPASNAAEDTALRPPRHLKSIIFSVALPAFLLGQDPTKRIICVSYSNELATKHAIDFRAVVTSDLVSPRFSQNYGQPGKGHPIRNHDNRTRLSFRHLAWRNTHRTWCRPDRTGRPTKAGRGPDRKHSATAPDSGSIQPCSRVSIRNPKERS